MKVIKEKNFIIFENDEGKISKLDMNTGIAYGVSGKALKSLNSDIFHTLKHYARKYSVNTLALRAFADTYFTKNEVYINGCLTRKFKEMVLILDKFQAIGYTFENMNHRSVYAEIGDVAEFTKWFAPFSKAYKADNSITFRNWVEKQKSNNFLKILNIENNEYMNDAILTILRDLYENHNATPKQIKTIAKALTYGGLYRAFYRGVYSTYYLSRILEDYIKCCNALEVEMEGTDLIKHYGLVAEMFVLRKDEMTNKLLAKVKIDKPILNFEYGNYEVVIPTTIDEFREEGENNRNCVGGYADYVAKGNRFVVFVREKDNLKKSLVTCDIMTNGVINQFHTFGNCYVTATNNPALYAFKEAYQAHLLANWG